ncbi:MAG: hypothetical protein ACSHYA_00705 [Opitutaceae bacterium]
MSLSFEDIADADLPDELPASRRSLVFKWILFILLILCIGTGSAVFYINRPIVAEVPESAKHLMVVEGVVADGVLPHTQEMTTEFEASLEHLKEGYKAPKLVEPTTVVSAVEQESRDSGNSFSIDPPVELSSAAKAKSSVIEVDVPALDQESAPEVLSSVVSAPVGAPLAASQELASDSGVELKVNQDWEGVVLVPDEIKLARAYTSEVRFRRVEAHPIDGGRLRVWSRIENLTDRDIIVEAACEFRFLSNQLKPTSFRPGFIAAGGALDMTFESVSDGVNSYTLMVKQSFLAVQN